MNLINNRYRVLKSMRQNRLVSTYLVSDIKKGLKAVQLNIINSEYLPNSLLNFYSKEFSTLTTIEDDNIIGLYDFGVIQQLDNKKVDKRSYFYVNEYVEINSSFMGLIKNMSEDEILNLFIEICKSINYLHLRGFVHGGINSNNIYVDGFNIKLKDIATVELEKFDYWVTRDNCLFFKAPEVLAGKNSSIASDIYSLGILLLVMCKKELSVTLDISEQISNLKKVKDSNLEFSEEFIAFFNKIVPIIRRMTTNNISERYRCITQVIEDINKTLNKNYKAHKQEQIEKLNFKTKILGRELEINSIINRYNSMTKLENQEKFIALHGEYGIGKTKVLKEVDHLLMIENANVYSSFALEAVGNLEDKAFYEIIRKIIRDCDKETLKRYEPGLVKVIPELGDNKEIIAVDSLPEDKEKIRILSNIVGFINDFLRGRPTVFIIDNLHMASELFIDLLQHMYLRSKNIIFIFSYCDGQLKYNKKLVEFLSKLSEKSDLLDIHLHGLSKEDTIIMIQDILRVQTKPANFGESIFEKTYGNPLFIEETMKKLFAEKIIYVGESDGVWNSQYDYDYSKLPVPWNMEQAVLGQISGIDSVSYEILNVLSIFKTGISSETIEGVLEKDVLNLEESIRDLESRGILCKKIEDRGFVYDFSNKILKELIKEKQDKENRKAKHREAASILEKLYKEGRGNKEELIYHFEKSGQKEKVIKYCLKNADKMESLKNRTEAIKNLIKAASMMDEGNTSSRKIKLLLRIGRIYEDSGNMASAIEYYTSAEELASRYASHKYKIDALNRIANIYSKRNDLEKTLNYLDKIEKLFYNTEFLNNHIEGYLECKEIQSRVYKIKQDYKGAEDICKKGISLCGEEHYRFKGLFYKNLGNIYLDISKIEQALKCYNESKVCFEKVSYSEGAIMILNNMAAVYGDYYQDNEAAIKFLLRAKEISEKNPVTIYKIMTMSNLSSFYFYDWNYELSLESILEVMKQAKVVEHEGIIFYSYNFITLLKLKLRNYKDAYQYYLLTKDKFEKNPDQGREIGYHYKVAAEMFYTFRSIEIAEEFINKALEFFENDESLLKWDSEIIYQFIAIWKKSRENNVLENVLAIKASMSNFKDPLKRLDIIYETAILLYEKGFIESATNLLNEAKKIKVSFRPSTIEGKLAFLNGVLNKRNNKLKCLNLAFDISKREKDMELYYKTCVALGDYYLHKKEYFYAVNYYFEAAEVVKNLIIQLPEEYRVAFANSPGVIKPYAILMTMKNTFDYNKIFYNEKQEYLISNIDELKALLDYREFKEILTNKYFVKSAKKIYNSYLPKGIRTVKDIVKNLYADPVKNLELIVKYLASVTLATRSSVIIDSYEQSFYAIASNDGSDQIPKSKYILEKARSIREPVLITEDLINNSSEFVYLPQGVKATMCIPIIMNSDNTGVSVEDDKTKPTVTDNPIIGYLYFESERSLNNFNEEGLNMCLELSRLAGTAIERHQLKISASIDKLTGTLARKYLEDALSEQIDRASECNDIFSIIMMDLDLFKQINDRLGHQTGDEVLKIVCSIVRDNIRKGDICGRYGGEEFIIILPKTDSDEAVALAETLRRKIEEAKILGDKMAVTVSMGIAEYPQHAQWKQELVEKADQALYVSKELGRNKCQLWSSEFSSKVKGTNKLTGIVSGNIVQDSRNVLVMLEIMELINQDVKIEDKIFNFLGRIIEITESEYGMLFVFEDGDIKKHYARKIFEEDWVDMRNYNIDIIKSVIDKKQGVYRIDWDEMPTYDSVTGIPDWNSVVVSPLIKSGQVKGILYLTVASKKKEFKFEEFNFINILGGFGVSIL